jgi:hypothetical protein
MDGLPKTPKEWLLAAIWGIFAFAAGFESVVSLVHGEWGPSAAAFVLFLALAGVALMLTFSDRLRQWAVGVSPNWILGACTTLLIIIALSPYVEQQRWPFASQLASLRGPTADEIADAVMRRQPPPAPSANDIADAVAGKLPKQASAQTPSTPSASDIAKEVVRQSSTPAKPSGPINLFPDEQRVTFEDSLFGYRQREHVPDNAPVRIYAEHANKEKARIFADILMVAGFAPIRDSAGSAVLKPDFDINPGITVRRPKDGSGANVWTAIKLAMHESAITCDCSDLPIDTDVVRIEIGP